MSGVVERAGPSVASVRVLRPDGAAALGTGSGFLFTPDGYVLTNSHVVRAGPRARAPAQRQRHRVSLSDGRDFEARWVGDDPDTDLALLCIDGMSRGALPWLALGRWPRPAVAMEIPARAGAVLFDEVAVDPSSGRVKLAVGPSIPELGGKAILLVSVELDEIRSLSDRVLVMFAGRVVGECTPDTPEGEMGLLMAGVESNKEAAE